MGRRKKDETAVMLWLCWFVSITYPGCTTCVANMQQWLGKMAGFCNFCKWTDEVRLSMRRLLIRLLNPNWFDMNSGLIMLFSRRSSSTRKSGRFWRRLKRLTLVKVVFFLCMCVCVFIKGSDHKWQTTRGSSWVVVLRKRKSKILSQDVKSILHALLFLLNTRNILFWNPICECVIKFGFRRQFRKSSSLPSFRQKHLCQRDLKRNFASLILDGDFLVVFTIGERRDGQREGERQRRKKLGNQWYSWQCCNS